jgi:hypothetical protein
VILFARLQKEEVKKDLLHVFPLIYYSISEPLLRNFSKEVNEGFGFGFGKLSAKQGLGGRFFSIEFPNCTSETKSLVVFFRKKSIIVIFEVVLLF